MVRMTETNIEKGIKYWEEWKIKFIMSDEDIAWADKEIDRLKKKLITGDFEKPRTRREYGKKKND